MMMDSNLGQIDNGFDDLSQTNTESFSNSDSTDNRPRVTLKPEKSQIENELFLSLKSHIDSQFKLNQINQRRIRSFERFRKYCQRATNFSQDTTFGINFDQEQFRNEYNRFDRNFRHWKKRIRKLRKETKLSLSTRYQNPYDTLYELFVKIESFDQIQENNNDSNQIYDPEISLNVVGPSLVPSSINNLAPSNCLTAANDIECDQENFNCFVEGCLETKFSSQKDLLDHLFQKHSNEDTKTIVKPKSTRGRKPGSKNTKTATKTSKTRKTTKKQTITKTKPPPITRPIRAAAISKKAKEIESKKIDLHFDSSETESEFSNPPTPPPKKKRGRAKKENTGITEVNCEVEGCQFITRYPGNMKLHMVTHSDERPHKCDKCEKTFKFKGQLKDHQNVHDGKRFECHYEGCTVNYATRKGIRKHIKIYHTKEAPVLYCQWEGCKYHTFDPRCLKLHQSVHSGERQFKCPECEQAFKSRANLWRHKLTHQKEHRFKCDFDGCEYSTNGHDLLKSHRSVHFGDRPFKCVWPDCEQAFKTASGLWSHKMIHENQRRYKCTWEGCEYAGNLWGSLQGHVEAVHEKKKKPRIRKRANRNVQTIDPSQLEYPKPISSIEPLNSSIRLMASCIGPELGGNNNNNDTNSHSTNAQILLL